MPHVAPKTTPLDVSRAQRRLRRLRVVPAPLPAVLVRRGDGPYGLAARVGLAHRTFRKGFLTIPNQIIGRQSRVQCCRPPGFEV
jgi:hypothetical protein